MIVKVLGTGCPKCNTLEQRVKKVIENNKIDAIVQKVTDLQEIIGYGIITTPGLVINEKVVSYGSLPKDEEILKWFLEV